MDTYNNFHSDCNKLKHASVSQRALYIGALLKLTLLCYGDCSIRRVHPCSLEELGFCEWEVKHSFCLQIEGMHLALIRLYQKSARKLVLEHAKCSLASVSYLLADCNEKCSLVGIGAWKVQAYKMWGTKAAVVEERSKER